MRGKLRTAIAGGAVLCVIPVVVLSQSLIVPTDTNNTRFCSDIFNVKRPGLSVNGFDNGGDNSHGYGLKQILEKVLNNEDQQIISTYNDINTISKEAIKDPSTVNNSLGRVDQNSNILQCRAFMALAEYILYKNGQASASDYGTAIDNLRSAFFEPSDYLLANDNVSGDEVKWTRSIGDYARAVDLYLALENAYNFWDDPDYTDPNSDTLLTRDQKTMVLSRLFSRMEAVNAALYHESIPGRADYLFEPGNRPLKQFVSIGYAALCMQNFLYYDPIANLNYYTSGPCNGFLQHAFRSAGLQAENNRKMQWSYQTHNGDRFWAEGAYYFEYTLNDVIPFWNAIRLNGMLDYNGYNISDPFKSGWFLRPLDWLADIATPEGQLPPLDDGNKHSIRYANLMDWSASYSSSTDPEYPGGSTALGNKVGVKFAWINKRIDESGGDRDESTILTEIAIPKATPPGSTPLPAVVGNTNESQTGDDAEQQAIVRHTDSNGNTYYLLVNGESGDAISRGEGHEQADQLQLLYYVNGTSYIMDTGYDHAGHTTNSSWNKYDLHNVFNALDIVASADNGLPPPRVQDDKLRKVSNHNWVNYLYYVQKPEVTAIYGDILLNHYKDDLELYNSEYNREVLFVKNDQYGLPPFIIDLNTDVISDELDYQDKSAYLGIMQYFSDTRNVDYSDYNGWIKLTGYNGNQNNPNPDNMYVFLSPVEWELNDVENTFSTNDAMVREEQHRDVGGPGSQSGYPATEFAIHKKNETNSCSWSTISIIQLSDDVPNDAPTPLISYPDDDYKREVQAWSYPVTSNVIDVVVKRGKVNGWYDSQFNNVVTFTVPAANNASLTLPGGKDYGFARLIKEGNLWIIDPDYQINLEQPGYFYTTNTTISTKTYSGKDLYIDDGVTLTLTGTVTLNDCTVHLGKDAVIKVTGNGNIQATGTTFKTLSGSNAASDRWNRIALNNGGSQFTQCTFEGGLDGIKMHSSGNQFYRCTFAHNFVGLWGSSGYAYLIGCNLTDNSYAAIDLTGTATVSTDAYDAYGGGDFTPTLISGNHYGIYLYTNAMAYLHYTRIDYNTCGVMMSGYARLYAGYYDYYGLDQGFNRFLTYSPHYAISNSSLTGQGSPWTVQARYNWWGTSNPPASIFYGSVDHSYPLDYDPTVSGAQDSYASQTASTSTPTMMDTRTGSGMVVPAAQITSTAPTALAKDRLSAIYTQLSKHPDDENNYRLLAEAYHLVHFYRKADTTALQSRLAGYRGQFRSAMMLASGDQSTGAGGQLQVSGSTLVSLSPGRKRLEETAVLLRMDHLLHQGKWDQVQILADRFGPWITQKDDRSALLGMRAVAWQRQGSYAKALAAYQAIEAIKPDPGVAAHYVAPDYHMIEAMLKDSMKAHGQSPAELASPKTAGPKLMTTQSKELPQKFALGANYPNPFNPTTMIPLSLPRAAQVRVSVYNIMGQRVAVLADRTYQAGRYELRFDGKGLASGVYFIRARLGGKTFIRRMLLIK